MDAQIYFEEFTMLKKISMLIVVALISFSTSAMQFEYRADNRGNHRLVIHNDQPSMLYCRIKGSNGTWGTASIPPGYTQYFNIWGAASSYWQCRY
tara:strand:- start:89187 stop:89471 length:285 start_codon:yes stop_codon:yes gene_type:complete